MLVALVAAAACGDDLRATADAGAVDANSSGRFDAGPLGEYWFVENAKILALREQTELFLDEARAAEIDAGLTRAVAIDIDVDGLVLSDLDARPSVYQDRVGVWSSDPEVQSAWDRGEIGTGVAALDQLIGSLEPTRAVPPSGFEYATIFFARWVKLETLVAELEAIPGIDAYSVPIDGDGHDVILVEDGDASRFTFYLKWGDCPAGCLYEHHWEVRVPHDEGLPAELVSEGGDPLPPL